MKPRLEGATRFRTTSRACNYFMLLYSSRSPSGSSQLPTSSSLWCFPYLGARDPAPGFSSLPPHRPPLPSPLGLPLCSSLLCGRESQTQPPSFPLLHLLSLSWGPSWCHGCRRHLCARTKKPGVKFGPSLSHLIDLRCIKTPALSDFQIDPESDHFHF